MSGVQALGIRTNSNEPFVPPPKPSGFSRKSFALWGLNLMTAGIYTAVNVVTKQHEITQLKWREKELYDRAIENGAKLTKLGLEVSQLLESISKSSSTNHTDSIEDLERIETKVRTLSTENLDPRNEVIQQVALRPIQFFATLICNIFTLGLYGVFQSNQLDHEIVCLQHHEIYNSNSIMHSRMERCSHILEQISILIENLKMRSKFKLIGGTVEGQNNLKLAEQVEDLQTANAKLDNRSKQLQAELQSLKEKHSQLVVTKATLDQAKKIVDGQVHDLLKANETLKHERNIFADNSTQLSNQVTQLNRDKTVLNASLQQSKDKITQINTQLEDAKKKLANQPQNVGPGASLDQLGPIPRKYTPTKDDKPIKGEFEDDEGEVLPNSQHVKTYKGESLVDLLRIAFNLSFDKLVDLGKKSAPGTKPKVQFKNSYNISSSKITMNVVYTQMVYELLSGAKLYTGGCHGFEVKLNPNVVVGYSGPMKVQTVKEEGEGPQKKRKVEVKTVFSHVDEFTPKSGNLEAANGVDPVSAKLILHRLTPAEKGHLLNLIYDPLIDDKHPELIATKAFMKAPGNKDRAKLIEIAYSLISDMAAVIGNRYNEAMTPCWQGKLDGDEEIFTKEVKGIDKVPELATPKPVDNSVWNVDVQYFEDVEVALVDPNSNLAKPATQVFRLPALFYSMLFEYQTIAQAMLVHKIVANPLDKLPVTRDPFSFRDVTHSIVPMDTNKALELFKQQYHISHFVFNAGCLFSNLLASICTHTSIVNVNATGNEFVKYLKNAMANYLDNPKNREKFEQDIKSEHKKKVTISYNQGVYGYGAGFRAPEYNQPMTVADYQYWLRNSHNGLLDFSYYVDPQDKSKGYRSFRMETGTDIGNLELDICAHMLGIRFVMFVTGEPIKIDSNGLIVPKDLNDKHNSFGPATGAFMPLFNFKNGSFYALYPKLKIPPTIDANGFQGEAITSINTYWDTCQKTSTRNGHLM